jgi:uncharacterized membrane protein YoaK (UPF0700 family)
VPLAAGVYAITAICGMLDAASYLGMGQVFVEIMTGNLVYLAFTIGSTGSPTIHTVVPPDITPYLVALGTFAVGAVLGGRLVRAPGRWGQRRAGFAVEWLALGVAVIATAALHPGSTGSPRLVVCGFLAFGMGIQNAMLRRWGLPDLATNVMTLTMVGLFAESTLGGGDNIRGGRRALSIGIFAVSAGFGAFLVRFGVLWPVLLGFLVLTAALPILIRPPEEVSHVP